MKSVYCAYFWSFYFLIICCSGGLHAAAGKFESLENRKEKTILLTGAAGFIGSNFLRYMFDKYPHYNFIVLDVLTYAGNLDNIGDDIKESPRFEFVYGSITNQELVDAVMKRSDWVVHFAAESHVSRSILDDQTFVVTDVMGTQVMMHALVKCPNVERFIHISTSEVYGTAEKEPMDEEHPLNPRSPYAAAKVGADRLVYSYYCTYDVPVVIIRPFNNYGPQQHIEKMIPKFITSALRGIPLTIHGDGSAQRDWLHVLDTSEALDKVLHHERFGEIQGEVINLGTGIATSILEIAHAILDYLQVPKSNLKFVGDRPGQVACHISSTNKAETLLGWTQKRTIQDELPAVIEWYRTHADWWKKLVMMQWVPIQTAYGKVEMH